MIFSLERQFAHLGHIHSFDELLSDKIRPEIVSDGNVIRQYQFDAPLHKLVEMDWVAPAIFILLPEAPLGDAKSLLLTTLGESFPELTSMRNVYLFPYGNSAMQLALRQAQRFFTKGVESIQILALHRDVRLTSNSKNNALADQNAIASECFISAVLRPSTSGFLFDWSSYEVQTRDKPLAAAISALLFRYRAQQGEVLNQCYFPCSGTEQVQNALLQSIAQLQHCLNQQSNIVFSDALVGNLGPCSGLFNLFHLQQFYLQEKSYGASLILDISATQYRSAAMFKWIESEKHISRNKSKAVQTVNDHT